MRHQQQTGFALISALIVLALVTGVTVAMAVNQRNGVDLATDVIRYGQLHQHGDGILLWSKGVLYEDIKNNNSDSVNDIWNQPLVDVEIDGGEIDAVIIDLQGKFNINNLAQEGKLGELAQQRFARLLSIVGVENNITDALVDWVDVNNEIRFPNGAEDDYYLSLDNPYRAANQAMQSISELLLVKGVDIDTYQKLLPYISVLPVGVGININTADEKILFALSEEVDTFAVNEISQLLENNVVTEISSQNMTETEEDDNDVEDKFVEKYPACQTDTYTQHQELCTRLIEEEKNKLFNKTEQSLDLADTGLIEKYNIDTNGLDVRSEYFNLMGQISYHDRTVKISFVLHRNQSNGLVQVLSHHTVN